MIVLVLGAGGSAGYNFSRCAIEAGHRVVACDTDPIALQRAAGHERELLEPNRSADAVNEIIDRYGVQFVHAQPDVEVRWLSAHANLLNATTFLPDRAALFICADKFRTAQVAGADAPTTVSIGDEDELAEALRFLGGDCWLRLRHGAGSAGALPVKDATIARAWMRHHEQFGVTADEWVLAERLPGRDLSWTGVYRDGELLAFGMKERLRLLGASRSPARIASTATLQTTIWRLDVQHAVERCIEGLQGEAHGVFMVDLREDAKGRPKITEINAGRFGTTSLHWLAAGGNLVRLYIEASRNEPLTARGNVCTSGVAWSREIDLGGRVVKLAA